MTNECVHSNFDENGVCTLCKEFYSAECDKNPRDIHPAMTRLISGSNDYDREGSDAYREHEWSF